MLHADDNPGVREVFETILTCSVYRVIEAVDGQEALEKFKECHDRIDLVVLDGIMPHKSGMNAWREIRAIRPQARVLFLTGYLDEEGALETLQKEGVPVL